MMFALASCESFTQFCEDWVDCIDGNEKDTDACVVSQEALSERASLYGCSEFFELHQECLEAESKCLNGNTFTAENRCEDEAREYSNCINIDSPGIGF